MDLNKFSKEILNKDIPLFCLKLILFMISSKKNEISIDEASSAMYINKVKILNELKKIKPIDGFLEIEGYKDGYKFQVLNTTFELLDIKKKKTKKEIEKTDAVNKKNDAISIVFYYWVEVMNKTSRTNLDNSRRRSISDALENNSIEDCKKAILGCSKNLWNMGKKDGNLKIYNSLSLIFRNQDKIEGFIQDSELPSIDEQLNLVPKSNKIEDRLNDNDWFEQRAGMMGSVMENAKPEQKTLELKNENHQLIEEIKIIPEQELDVDGLVFASQKAFYSFCDDIVVKKESNVIEGEVIQKDDDIPYYLKITNNKEA